MEDKTYAGMVSVKNIIVIVGGVSAMQVFAEQTAEGFREIGYHVLTVNVSDEEEMRRKIYAFAEECVGEGITVLFFNQAGMDLSTEAGKIIWNELDADCYDYVVDHPMYYHEEITYPIRRLTVICVDEYHQRYVERFYPGRVRSFFLPHGGSRCETEMIPFEKRNMDVLFVGFYKECDVEAYGRELGSALKPIWMECYELLCSQTWLTLEQGLEYCLRKRRLTLTEEDFRDIVRLFAHRSMDILVKNTMRAEVIKTLANADIRVHVYGPEAWRSLECKQENLIIHDSVSFHEVIRLIANTKIFLNVLPWYKAGAHERIYSAMLGGAVSLTDSNEYLERTLTDGRDVLFYSLDSLEKLPDKVKYYLNHPKKLKEIADQGYLYAKDTQTWQYRARQMAEVMEGNADGR